MSPEVKWILASASPRRKEILDQLGMKFQVDPSRIPEPPRMPNEAPSRYVVRVARIKAKEVGKKHKSGIVAGADTVVVLGNSIMGKPITSEEARTMLHRLSGRWHEVFSGVCILDCKSGRSRCGYSRTRVHFRRLSPGEILWYASTWEWRDKAGGYAVQGYASLFIDRIEGCYLNVVGFPAATFEKLCRTMGINLIADCGLRIADLGKRSIRNLQSTIRND